MRKSRTLALVAPLLLVWTAPAARGADPEPPEAENPTRIAVDPAKREVSFPFVFINPSRVIEVFACSPGGPTHETVIVTPVSGSALRDAFIAIGLKPGTDWQANGPEDFALTQGSRAVLSLAWTWKGRRHEKFAEEVIRRPAERSPEFIRGFSFLPEAGGPGAALQAVEFTYGSRGSGRSSQAFALLVHASSFPFLLPWLGDPEIDTDTVTDLQDLVEQRVEGTATVRAVNEVELVAMRRARRPEWAALYDALEPIAREIDALKPKYAGAPPPRARLIAARINLAYMRSYAAERAFQLRRLRAAGAEDAAAAEELARHDAVGFDYAVRRSELELAKEEHLARKAEATDPAEAEREGLRAQAKERRIEALFHEWTAKMRGAERAQVAARIPTEESAFVKSLLENDLVRLQGDAVFSEGVAAVAEADARRLEAQAGGALTPEAAAELAAIEAAGKRKVERGELLQEKAQAIEKIRWKEDDLDNPQKGIREEAKRMLPVLKQNLYEIEAKLKALEEAPPKVEAGIGAGG
ncbi:MAG: hypothetical protein JXP34_27300 [Planctomycetes bacterium]|nr:hypothetical protein [Planctomycetota bacterium]